MTKAPKSSSESTAETKRKGRSKKKEEGTIKGIGLFDHIKHNLHNRWCRLKLIWADGGYPSIIAEVRQRFGWTLQIVKRSDDVKGFQVLPHRWVVERTFGWLGRYRRLARDYEHTTLSSESMVYIASTRRMLKMLAT